MPRMDSSSHHGRSGFQIVRPRLPDAKGDRVKIGMSGKFLAFKYDGATGNDQMLGTKEG